MKIVRSVFSHVKDWFSFLLRLLIFWFKTSQAKNLEILALRSQLAHFTSNLRFSMFLI